MQRKIETVFDSIHTDGAVGRFLHIYVAHSVAFAHTRTGLLVDPFTYLTRPSTSERGTPERRRRGHPRPASTRASDAG